MYHVLFAQIIHAERERELEAALRRRRLLRPQDQTIEPSGAKGHETASREPSPRALVPPEDSSTASGRRWVRLPRAEPRASATSPRRGSPDRLRGR